MSIEHKTIHPIFVIDDEEPVLLAIDTTLRMAGFEHIVTIGDSRDVLKKLSESSADVILLDLNMPHVTGERLLEKITEEFPEIPVIIVTGAVDVETAVRCIKSGAFDYVVKPVEEDRLLAAVNRALSFQELKRENLALKQHIMADAVEKPEAFNEIVTRNKKMLLIFQYIESIARTKQPVLIRGETGVGKELIAKTIHELSGLSGKFVAVNVAGLDDNVFADSLFGHVRGAFTGADQNRPGLIEKAADGTLFLDEIGDLGHGSQVKLLRLLQEGEFLPLGSDKTCQTNARIVAATNRNLSEMQNTGEFRKDLNFRLRTHRIYIPPLRERKDDIPLLLDHFLEDAAKTLDKKKPTPPSELVSLLKTYSFPGNIRELKSMVIDAVSSHKGGVLSMDVFKSHIGHDRNDSPEKFPGPDKDAPLITFPSDRLPTLKQVANALVEEAMKRADNNQTIAASMIGVSQQALSKRLKNMQETK